MRRTTGGSRGGGGSGGRGIRKDPFWKYGNEVQNIGGGKGYLYIECTFCKKVVMGGVKRLKDHLACTRKNVAQCPKVPEEVKQEMIAYLKKGEVTKHMAQQKFDDMVDSGAYYGNRVSLEDVNSCPGPLDGLSGGTRGIRGSMDRFVTNLECGKDDSQEVPTTTTSAKEARNQVCLDIGRFFFENGIAFNVATSPSFANMCRSIGLYGRGLKPPTMHELRTWILKEEVNTTGTFVAEVKKTWIQTGVSILSDGWKDMRGRGLINILVNNPHGTVFLRSIDASDAVKDSDMLFKLLDDVVEEIGEELVVQVVTDNASAYKAAGRKLMEKRPRLYWTPCAAHCLDLMLEKIGELPQHKNALLKAKKVCNFIYNHGYVLAMMRSFTNKELIRPAATRFATAYLTLQSICQSRQPLESMFTSTQWANSTWAKKAEGKAIKKIILNDKNFWPSVVYAIQTTKPLVGVLRMVDSESMPAMGFIYGAMDAAKEEIAKNLGGEEGSYREIWNIIDEKWEYQLHRDLHAAAYFLNPHYRYDENVEKSNHPEIKKGLFNCMHKFVLEEDIVDVDLQMDKFRNKRGFFGYKGAMLTSKKRSPADWWIQYGDETPQLQKFAVKILSLTCSASGCERNWSSFNQIHTKRRNRLSAQKLNSLVYIMYNKRLKDRHLKLKALEKNEDPLIVDSVPSDDEWIVDQGDENASTLNEVDDDDDDDIDVDLFENAQESGRRKERSHSTMSQRGKGKRPLLVDEESEWEDVDTDEEENNNLVDNFFNDSE